MLCLRCLINDIIIQVYHQWIHLLLLISWLLCLSVDVVVVISHCFFFKKKLTTEDERNQRGDKTTTKYQKAKLKKKKPISQQFHSDAFIVAVYLGTRCWWSHSELIIINLSESDNEKYGFLLNTIQKNTELLAKNRQNFLFLSCHLFDVNGTEYRSSQMCKAKKNKKSFRQSKSANQNVYHWKTYTFLSMIICINLPLDNNTMFFFSYYWYTHQFHVIFKLKN